MTLLATGVAFLGCLPAVLSLSSLRLRGPPALPETASHFLHPALGSFSIETAFLETFLGNSSSPNELTNSLFENLRIRTGVPPEVRIGGITADSTYWDPGLDISSFNFVDKDGVLHNTTIGPGFWNSVKLLPEGTKITVNLDLRDLNYTGALEVATSALRGLPQDQLASFEIGNEPDHYLSFTPRNYSEIWATWAQNLSSALNLQTPRFQIAATVDDPVWPYDSPGANRQLDCVNVFASGIDFADTTRSCSEHTYQYSVCDPPRIALATLPNLVNHTRLAMYLDLWQPRINAIRDRLGPHSFVIGEYNSVSCSGRDGVSNTFGQSLWLLDTTFYAASLNISRMFIHQGGPLALQSSSQLNHGGLSFYNLWYPVQNMNGPVKVFPSYSAYLFLAETLGTSKTIRIANIYPGRQANGSTITPASGDESDGGLVAYGFWDDSASNGDRFPTKLALLNLQVHNQTQVGPRPSTVVDISAFKPSPNSEVRIRRLQAPGADVKDGNVTLWAGQSFSSGRAVGRLAEERTTGETIVLSNSEAALVFLI